MSQKRSIGLLTPGWPGQNTPNGIATSVYFLAMGLRIAGHTPVVFTGNIDGPCPEGIPVVPLPELKWSLWDRLRGKIGDKTVVHENAARSIAAAVDTAYAEHGLDALILEETNGWAHFLDRQLPVPVIVALHGPWLLHKSFSAADAAEHDAHREHLEQLGFEIADGLSAPSRNVLEAVARNANIAAIPQIVLPNSIPVGAEAPFSAGLEDRTILFVGRFDLHKGGDTVLEAFALLSQSHPDARLTFAGPDRGVVQPDGSMRNIEDALAALPDAARARVTYLGPADRDDVTRLRDTHAISLIASRYENFPYTVLEALAAGQAIVCTDVGGPAEVLTDEETALLVPPGDAPAMAAALGRLLDDASLVRRLGQAGQTKAQTDFAPETIAAQTIAFIETILQRHHSANRKSANDG